MNVIEEISIEIEGKNGDPVSLRVQVIGDDLEAWYTDFGINLKLWSEQTSEPANLIPIGSLVWDKEDDIRPNPAVVIHKSSVPAKEHWITPIEDTVYGVNPQYSPHDPVYVVRFVNDWINRRPQDYAYPAGRLGVIRDPMEWVENHWPKGLQSEMKNRIQECIVEVNENYGTYPHGKLVDQHHGTL